MTPRLAPFVALLRGINVGGKKPLPMAGLRALAEDLGWSEVRTYINSGNIVFRAAGTAAALETALERAIDREFGMDVPVVVRSARTWAGYAAGNPWPETSQTEPNRVMLAVPRRTPRPEAEAELRQRASGLEQVIRAGDVIWIHYTGGFARSRLSPGLLDRAVGSPVTTRNARTVQVLDGMLAELASG